MWCVYRLFIGAWKLGTMEMCQQWKPYSPYLAQQLQFSGSQASVVTILKPLCPHFSLSVGKWRICLCLCAAQKFPNLVGRGSTILLTMGQVSVSHPRPDPLLKNSIEEISFFSGRKYRGNIVPNLQSSDPSPTSSATEPYLHRALEEGRKGRGGGSMDPENYLKLQMCWKKQMRAGGVCWMVCCQSD